MKLSQKQIAFIYQLKKTKREEQALKNYLNNIATSTDELILKNIADKQR